MSSTPAADEATPLKPCPHCAGRAVEQDGYPLAMVRCTNCGARVQPPPEAALCGECGHPQYWLDKDTGKCTKIVAKTFECGHRCTFPAPEAGLHVAGDVYKSTKDFWQVEAPAVAETCRWTEDSNGNWDTSCDNKYIIVEGTPSENGMKFCTFCSLRLEEVVNRYDDPE